MSGETEKDVSGWTVDTSQVYLESRIIGLDRQCMQRFADLDKAIIAALDSAGRAVAKAEVATEKRFESVNEFRQTLSDQTANFLPRPEAAAMEKALAEKMDVMQSRLDRMEGGNKGAASLWALICGGIGLLIGLGGFGFALLKFFGK